MRPSQKHPVFVDFFRANRISGWYAIVYDGRAAEVYFYDSVRKCWAPSVLFSLVSILKGQFSNTPKPHKADLKILLRAEIRN